MNIRCRSGELSEHLKTNLDKLAIQAEQFDSEVTSFDLVPGGLNETERGLHYANFRYRSVYYFERLPKHKLALLALLAQNYLDNHDDVREKYELPPLHMDVISLDSGATVDVDITVEFVDEAYLIEEPGGPIEIFGKNYDAGDYDLRIAETLDEISEHVDH